MTDAKTCSKCGETKSVEEFYTDKERSDGLRSNCKACMRASRVAFEEANRDLVRERNRSYARDPEAVRRNGARKRAADPDGHRERNRLWRAQQLGNVAEWIDVEEIWERDNSTCQLCGELVSRDVPWPLWMSPSIDHIKPLSLGGHHVRENVALAHLGCNQSKGNRIA